MVLGKFKIKLISFNIFFQELFEGGFNKLYINE